MTKAGDETKDRSRGKGMGSGGEGVERSEGSQGKGLEKKEDLEEVKDKAGEGRRGPVEARKAVTESGHLATGCPPTPDWALPLPFPLQ